jgi:DMSO/TMAO reductase YedYZ molybdopterin-dependent catalytic subunit
MQRITKIAVVTFALLIVVVFPLSYYVHPTQVEAGTIQIIGNVKHPLTLTFNQLKELSNTTIQAALTSSGSPQENGVYNYTGVTLKQLLSLAQAVDNATSVYVQASDAYGATLLIKDAQNPNTILAYEKNGAPMIPLKSGGEGPVRLVIGGDQFAQRWVKGAVSIQVT